MADPFYWTTADGMSATNFNKSLDRSTVNMVRNGRFEAWSLGTGPATDEQPDGWGITTTNGTIERDASGAKVGTWNAKIVKLVGDANYTRIYQYLNPIIRGHIIGFKYTFTAWVKCNVATKARIYIQEVDGGAPATYSSSYATGTWSKLKVTHTMTGSADSLIVGLDCPGSTTSDTYIDGACCVLGEADAYYSPPMHDMACIGQDWDNNDTLTRCAGGLRIQPYTKTFTLAGGAATETESKTLLHGCAQIIVATANLYSSTGTAITSVGCHTNNYSSTGFDVVFYETDGGNLAAGDYMVKGIIVMLGWDAYKEVFGA
jgi:hypothetical protein